MAVLTIHRMVPHVPSLYRGAHVGFITLLTVQGIKFTARTNEVLLGFMLLVTARSLVQASRYVVLHQTFRGLFSLQPIYNPATFDVHPLAAGTSLRARIYRNLTGLNTGGGGEESQANVMLASVLFVSFTGTVQRACKSTWRSWYGPDQPRCQPRDCLYGCRSNRRQLLIHRVWSHTR